MRILVTGREGQVVQSLIERGTRAGHEIVPLGRPTLDLSADGESIDQAITAVRPDAIISAAAYTAVDKAESDREAASAVNAEGPARIAESASRLGVPLVHLSTDYVFDGTKTSPYVESDTTAPTSVYGQSKLAGEQALAAAHPNSAILRTAWVYSPFGANFVKTMLRVAGSRDEVSVVADQIGSPTSALDIADGVLAVVRNMAASDDPALRGVFHMTGSGEASWAELAEAIFAISSSSGGPVASVRHIATADYPTAAKRPANSRLDCSKLASAHDVRLPQWRDSLPDIVVRILDQTKQASIS